jgi:hypothetical protein
MKEHLEKWLEEWHEPSATLALAILFADRKLRVKKSSPGFPATAIENSLRGVVETFRVLSLHRSTSQWLSFVYDEARLYAAFRNDGHCLGLYVPTAESDFTPTDFSLVATEFLKIGASTK